MRPRARSSSVALRSHLSDHIALAFHASLHDKFAHVGDVAEAVERMKL